MKVGYREFYKYFSISVFMGCGYLMLNFWEEAKGQISSYNMQDKAFMIFWFMIYTFGVAYGIINALTSIYIYEGSITNFVGFPIPLVALSAHIE